MDEFLKTVFETVNTVKGIDPATLSADSKIESLKFDSLDEVEVMMTLEERLGVEIDQASISRCKTLGDLAQVISGLIAKANPA